MSTAILSLLTTFLAPTSCISPAARAQGQRLYNILTHRHSTFMGQVTQPYGGLRFGANALPINPATQCAYMQPHPKSGGYLWPCGGGFEREDNDDPLITAKRELFEEAPHFIAIQSQVHLFQPALLDVHFQTSLVPTKPGEWCFFTIGLLIPADFMDVGTQGGQWPSLSQIANGPDVSTARAASRVLAA